MMTVIPAIDLRGGRCVRLLEGRADQETVYSDDPLEQARVFKDAGAERIHVVDLDGAFEGSPKNTAVIEQIARIADIEVGGGLRNRESVARVLGAGARYAMLGTVIAEDPELFNALCAEYPGKIIAAIDAREGIVATRGWVQATTLTAKGLALACRDAGAAAIVYTDIARDGTGHGVNIAATAELAASVEIPVIASGGVQDIDDVRALLDTKVSGVIIGRAIYEQRIDLAAAIREARAHGL